MEERRREEEEEADEEEGLARIEEEMGILRSLPARVDALEKPKNMSYADILRLAMKREEKAHAFYSDFAAGASEASHKKLFEVLASSPRPGDSAQQMSSASPSSRFDRSADDATSMRQPPPPTYRAFAPWTNSIGTYVTFRTIQNLESCFEISPRCWRMHRR